MIVKIENWSVGLHLNQDACSVPEQITNHLHGEVYGYPGRPDGDVITTSRILHVNGDIVTCLTRQYRLGEPSKEYIEWCKANGCHVPTKDCPIKTPT